MTKVLNFDSWQRERLFSASMSKPVLKPTQLPAHWMPGALYTGVGADLTPHTSIWYCWLRKNAAILPVHYFLMLRGNLKMTVNLLAPELFF